MRDTIPMKTLRRRYALKHKFGITVEQYDAMLVEQGGVCAVCRRDETRTNCGVIRNLSVDHDHETGTVRGLLCAGCNQILGIAEDDQEVLRAAAAYLDHRRGR